MNVRELEKENQEVNKQCHIPVNQDEVLRTSSSLLEQFWLETTGNLNWPRLVTVGRKKYTQDQERRNE